MAAIAVTPISRSVAQALSTAMCQLFSGDCGADPRVQQPTADRPAVLVDPNPPPRVDEARVAEAVGDVTAALDPVAGVCAATTWRPSATSCRT